MFLKGFAVGMEEMVVGTHGVGSVFGLHGVAYIVAYTHRPGKVVGPEGRVGAADIGYGAAAVTMAQQCFAKADPLLEFVGEAAVANHEGGLVIVVHVIGIGHGKLGFVPAVPVAVGAVVYI